MSKHAIGAPSAGGYDPADGSGTLKKKAWRRKPIEDADVLKARVEIDKDGEAAVVDIKAGPVTLADKIKRYYHTVIVVVAGLLAFLTEIGPIGDMLPDPLRSILAGAILVVGALLTFLKSNEVWIEKL